MSPRSRVGPIEPSASKALFRMSASLGQTIRDARLARSWTLRQLSERAGVSPALVHRLERGDPLSLETYARVAVALDLRPELVAIDPRKRERVVRTEDPVHAAMGEVEARRLRSHSFNVAIDEPYQHYQFAGRADVLAWDLERRALLHIENRTRFPNLQDAFGSYNAKRAYLSAALSDRLGVGHRGWETVTHAMVVLWSAEALHAIRLHLESFRATCPDGSATFEGWWAGMPPDDGAVTSTLVVFDPVAGRARVLVGMERIGSVRPRYRGYADAATAVSRASPPSRASRGG
jgi:transcriptional regulator with XRE-family HTH domain